MTSSEFITLDPEFEELLREVAADPESSLLRVPRPKRIRSLFDRGTPVGVLEPGLTRAEQHLLQVHRNELAWLLRQACLVKLVEGPKSRLYVSRYITADRQVELMRPSALRSRLDRERETAAELPEGASVLSLLDQCVSDPIGDDPTVGALAAASFRLERTDEARIMSAMELAQGSGPRSALRVLGDVLSMHPTQRNAASSWSQVGLAYSKLLEFGKARDSYSTLCRLGEDIVFGWMGLLVMSLQLGDADMSLSATIGLDSSTSLNMVPVTDWTESLRKRRKDGDWRPTLAATTLVPRIRDSLGEPARRLADVLA